jgi:hypothetical protein
MRRRHLGTVLLVVLFALAACGGGDEGEKPASDFDKQLAFSKCMRENGVDMPDPKEGPDGSVLIGAAGAGPDDAAFTAAYEKCRAKLPNGGTHTMSPEERQKQLTFARCMRDNGIADYPDPPADGGAGERLPLPHPSDPGYEAAVANFQQAAEKCGMPGGMLPAQPAGQ